MSSLPSHLLLAASLAGLGLGSSLPARAAVPAFTLVHEINFNQDADSAQGAHATLSGGAVVRDGVIDLSGPQAFADYAALIPSVENGAASWWSVSLWARQRQATAVDAVMVGQGVAQGFLPEFALALRSDGEGHSWAVGINQSGWAGARQDPVADVTSWHHYAVAMAENIALLYIDGQYTGHGAAGWDYSTPYFHGSTRLGRQVANYGQQFEGQLDDVRIYSGRIDDATVRAQFLAGPSVSAVPEPASGVMVLAGLAGLLGWTRRVGLSGRRNPPA